MAVHTASRPAPRRLPGWARLLVVPIVVAVLLGGVWLFGGQVSNDMHVAMAAVVAWFGVAGIAALLTAWRWRPLALPVVATFLVTTVAVVGYLGWSTLRDRVVNEDVPTAGAGSANVRLASGRFTSLAHSTAGTAAFIRLASGGRVLTLTGFETDAGPDLRVYLAPGTGDDVDDNIDLGGLKGNKGSQQYEIAGGVDLDKYRAVVIWCRAFSVAFGKAVLARGE